MYKPMTELWRERLIKAIEADPRSLRAISKDAGLGPNYVTQMISGNKGPTAAALVKLAETLQVSVTFIFTGAEMSQVDEDLLKLAAEMDETEKTHLLGLLRARKPA